MKLHHKVRAVERVFQHLDKDLAAFKEATGMQCIAACGICCKKPDIAASPLEFLPLAFHLFNQNQAYQWLEKLKTNPEQTICQAFKPLLSPGDRGFCGQYQHRGLICRLFGFSAMLDKHGQPKLVSCNPIKTQAPTQYEKAQEHIESGNPVPVMRNYYFRLRSIDSELGQMLIPINQAITKAIEEVLAYYAYRRPKRA